jgi:hypothetical protein
MAINFPSSPSVGDTYTYLNVVYQWDGTFWTPEVYTFLTPQMFGAKGDGVTDDTAAFNAMLASGAYLRIFIPTDTYILTAPLVSNAQNLIIEGQGQYATYLKWTADCDGFQIGQTTASHMVTMRGLRLMTTEAASTRAAIRMTCDVLSPTCIFEQMAISGESRSTDYWGIGIKVTDGVLSVMRDVNIFGRAGGTSAQIASATDQAIWFESTRLDVAPTFNNCWIHEYDTGIYVHTTGNPGQEGIYVRGCNIVACNYGVHVRSEASGGYKTVQVYVLTNHIQALIQGVKLYEVTHFDISHNNIFSSDAENVTTEAIYIENSVPGVVMGNVIEALPVQTTMKGIVIHNSANVIVEGNWCKTPGNAVHFTGITFESYHGGNIQDGAGSSFVDGASGVNGGLYKSTIPLSTGGAIIAAASTNYFVNEMSSFENTIWGVAACKGILRNLIVYQNVAPGASQTTTYTLRVNNADTGVTCQVSGSNISASDTTHHAQIAAGQAYSVKVVQSAGAANTICMGGVQFEPT